VTSGDDVSKRYFWEDSEIRINEEDPELCPDGRKLKENCRSMEIWAPRLWEGVNNTFILTLKDDRIKGGDQADRKHWMNLGLIIKENTPKINTRSRRLAGTNDPAPARVLATTDLD
jgi:hypothetical protein